MQHRGNSHGKPQQWQVLRRLFYPMAQCWLWPNAGCMKTLPHPISAAVFYTTQLECCKGAFGGQSSNACVMGLPNPPTAKPSVAPTTVAPTIKSPTTLAGQGGGWYADYGTAWPNAGCKNTTPLPIHATMFYATQLECCKGAFGGQTSNACVMGLPNPPTAKPTAATTSKPTFAPIAKPTAKPAVAPTPSDIPTIFTPSQTSTSSPSVSPSETPTTSNPSKSPTTFNPTTSSPTQFCFPDKITLKSAVDNYISENCATITTCTTRTQY